MLLFLVSTFKWCGTGLLVANCHMSLVSMAFWLKFLNSSICFYMYHNCVSVMMWSWVSCFIVKITILRMQCVWDAALHSFTTLGCFRPRTAQLEKNPQTLSLHISQPQWRHCAIIIDINASNYLNQTAKLLHKLCHSRLTRIHVWYMVNFGEITVT